MSIMEEDVIALTQEPHASAVDTEMTCLLTPELEDSKREPNPEEMSYPYYQGPSPQHGTQQNPTPDGHGHGHGIYHSPPAGNFHMGTIGMGQTAPQAFGGPTPFGVTPPSIFNNQRGRGNSNNSRVLLSAINPGPLYATNDQLDVSYAYGMRRDDGTFTRLIRADHLPAHVLASMGIPERQISEGLIIVARPRQPSPARRSGPMPTVPVELVSRLPVYNPNGPQYASPQAGMMGVQKISPTNSNYRPRREKVYCDKWLHDGVCAFTQLGCRYKHEMPMDKETQVSLGLNHGLPAWYKRLHAVELRGPTRASLPAPPPPPPQIQPVSASYNNNNNNNGGGRGLNSNWRTRDQVVVASQSLPGDAYQLIDPNAPFPGGRFGPIGPPPPAATGSHSARRDSVKREEGELSSDDDDGAGILLYHGRQSDRMKTADDEHFSFNQTAPRSQ